MGYDFYLKAEGPGRKALSKALETLVTGGAGFRPLQCLTDALRRRVASGCTTVLEEDLWLAVEGSGRGVNLQQKPEQVVVTLPALSSRTDWAVACWLLGQGMAAGAKVSDEEDATLSAEDLRPQAFDARCAKAWQQNVEMVKAVAQNEHGPVSLPCGRFEIKLSLGDLAGAESGGLEALTTGRFLKYGDAFPAASFRVGKDDASSWTYSSYALIPTLISPEVDGVMLVSGRDVISELVPLAKVREVLAGRMEETGPSWYLPALDLDADAGVLTALCGDDFPATLRSLRVAKVYRMAGAAALMVVWAGGTLDTAAAEELLKSLQEKAKSMFPTNMVQAAKMLLIEGGLKDLIDGAASRSLTLAKEVEAGMEVLPKVLPQVEAASYKRQVLALADMVAKTGAKGGFLGFGVKIDPVRQAVLTTLKNALGEA